MTKYNAAELAEMFHRGGNLMQWLRDQEQSGSNTPTAILYAYDVQAGTYTEHAAQPETAEHKQAVAARLASAISAFEPATLLDAGCGEATTLVPLLRAMGPSAAPNVLAFDLSVSRLLYAQENLRAAGFVSGSQRLFTAELEHVPLPDGSVDVVTTFHALEPNRGREEPILAELLRVAGKGLVLVEPSRDIASPQARARMDRLGYVVDLAGALERLGHRVMVEPFGIDVNPDNPAALIVVRKQPESPPAEPVWTSPVSGTPLVTRADCLFSPIDGHAFPVIHGIACLTREFAILASKLGAF